jgi:L-cysteine desulfidase
MSRRITDVSNLVEVVENKMISVDSVECKTKFSADMTETNQITPNKFIKSIQFMNETIFKDAIDFYYEVTGINSLLIECGMRNQFMEEYYRVECAVCDGVSAKDIDKKLRETIFEE